MRLFVFWKRNSVTGNILRCENGESHERKTPRPLLCVLGLYLDDCILVQPSLFARVCARTAVGTGTSPSPATTCSVIKRAEARPAEKNRQMGVDRCIDQRVREDAAIGCNLGRHLLSMTVRHYSTLRHFAQGLSFFPTVDKAPSSILIIGCLLTPIPRCLFRYLILTLLLSGKDQLTLGTANSGYSRCVIRDEMPALSN